jgi:hypothetical protein
MKKFTTIYQRYVKPEKASIFEKLWHQIIDYYIHKGWACAATASLYKTDDSFYVSLTRWEDEKKSWGGSDGFQDLPLDIKKAIGSIKECIDLTRGQVQRLKLEAIDNSCKE